jgi:hypothetical protein
MGFAFNRSTKFMCGLMTPVNKSCHTESDRLGTSLFQHLTSILILIQDDKIF